MLSIPTQKLSIATKLFELISYMILFSNEIHPSSKPV